MGDHRCNSCVDFVASGRKAMKRHVAIVHGKDTFSTLQCDVCQRKFYDMDQFQEHVRESPACFSDHYKVKPLEPTKKQLKKALSLLVGQMMKPIPTQIIPIPSTESSAPPKPVVQETAKKNKASLLQNSSSSSIKRSIKTELIGDSDTPEIISSESIVDQAPMNGESGIQNLENEMVVDSAAAQETDMQHHGIQAGITVRSGRISKRQSLQFKTDQGESSVDRGSNSMSDELMRGVQMEQEMEIEQAVGGDLSAARQNGDQGDIRNKHSVNNLRLRCRQIIQKRIHNGRLTCSQCNGSISAANWSNPFNHIRGHFSVPLIRCRRCTFKAKYFTSMGNHLYGSHGASSDQYIDELADHVEEFIKIFAQCFDHDLQGGNIAKGHRFSNSKRQSLQIKTDQGQSSVDHGSISMYNELIRVLMEQDMENEGAVGGYLSGLAINQDWDQGDISSYSEPTDSTKWLVCDKCGYPTDYEPYFYLHRRSHQVG